MVPGGGQAFKREVQRCAFFLLGPYMHFFLFVIVFSTRIVVHLVLRSFEKGAYLVPSVNIITRPAAMILVLLLSGRSQRQAEEGMIEDAYLGV